MIGFWAALPRPFTVLAPMEEVTDTCFRQIVTRCGRPDVFYSEFTSVEGLCSKGREAVIHRLQFTQAERPLVAQIWGLKPESFYKTARQIRLMGFDGVDINMGCPVPKIIKGGSCAALIDNPALAKELIAAVKEGAEDLPVSVKTRIGFRTKRTEAWAAFLLEFDLAALTIHGRLAKHGSSRPADWGEIAQVVQIRNALHKGTLIIGNGDVLSMAEVHAKAQEFGVDGVMIGRGVFQNPFVFHGACGAPHIRDLSVAEKLTLYLQHIDLFRDTWGAKRHFGILKKFAKIYLCHFQGAGELRDLFMQAHDLSELRNLVVAELAELEAVFIERDETLRYPESL